MGRIFFAFALTASMFAEVSADSAKHGYRDAVSRTVKGLSETQMADLKAGRGMGLSLPAELQGYPGPRHVLELAGELNLSTDQRNATQALIAEMTSKAVAFGLRLIDEEKALDALFASGQATSENVRAQAAKIATVQGELRFTHLKYHLAMTQELSPEQRQRYAELRGYTSEAPAHKHHHHKN